MSRQMAVCGGLLILAAAGWPSDLPAEVQTIQLPADYADFALHPETGSLAAISAATNEAVFFRAAQLATASDAPAARVRVGATPCSVFYKRYRDQHVFAIVCSQDSHMYLVDAGSPGAAPDSEFALRAKVELTQSGVSLVTGSINPEDPFVYYCYGSGHDSETGVVSLRDMRNQGIAFGDSMDCAISASGEVAYRRGPWSPSGFESLLRTNQLSDDKPQFARLFYDHTSTAAYLPDPFDRCTAAGSRVYSRGLEKLEAGLDFVPLCFFQDRPVVVGTSAGDSPVETRPGAGATRRVALQAASYNTFTSIGQQVLLPPRPVLDDRTLARGVPPQADFKTLRKRARLLADDVRSRVVYAEGSWLCLVPLTEFALPDEPLLLARLTGSGRVFVAQENRLALEPLDERVNIVLDDLPEGMKSEGNRLSWTPTLDQVGPATLVATIEHGGVQRTLQFELDVAYPSVQLPFSATDLAVDEAGKRAVIWDGPAPDRFGRLQVSPSPSAVRIAVLDPVKGEVHATRQLAEPIGRAVVSARHVVLQPPLNTSPKCEVLRISDLEREKSLIAGGPIREIALIDERLLVRTDTQIEVFDAASFDRLKTFSAAGAGDVGLGGTSPINRHGLLVQGVLYGFDLQPKLIFNPLQLPILGGARPAAVSLPLADGLLRQPQVQPGWRPPSQGQTRLATLPVPGTEIQVSLDQRQQQLPVPGATHTWRTQLELALTASGAVDQRQVILRKQFHAQTNNAQPPASRPVLQVANREAFVIYDRQLHRWPIPLPQADAVPAAERLRWVPQQSALALGGTGKLELKHAVRGGKPPVHFSAAVPSDSIRIDEVSGTATLDAQAILDQAVQTLETLAKQRNRGEPYVQTLREQAAVWIDQATHALARRPSGFPVAVPIQISATDSDLATASLQYFVIAEVPSTAVTERLQALDVERTKQLAQMQAARQQAKAPSPTASAGDEELAEVKRRVEALEQRLDLITRQLNMLLDRLDKPPQP